MMLALLASYNIICMVMRYTWCLHLCVAFREFILQVSSIQIMEILTHTTANQLAYLIIGEAPCDNHHKEQHNTKI